MLNASVKELENQVFTFHLYSCNPLRKLWILLLAMTTHVKALVISTQNKEEFLDPNQRIIES
jgi:hypothetical protein